MNIIIADDEYYARKALFSCISQAFNHAGFTDVNLLECEDAEQALVHLQEEKIDIVFTDIKMHKKRLNIAFLNIFLNRLMKKILRISSVNFNY